MADRSFSALQRLVVRLAALLMLMVAATHALAPAALPTERVRGSAFGATTLDVSTVGRGLELAAEQHAILPEVPVVRTAVSAVAVPAAVMPPPRSHRPTGPPLRGFLTSIVPGAPPAA